MRNGRWGWICTITSIALTFALAAPAQHAADPCRQLRRFKLPADRIGLPTTGAVITSAEPRHEQGTPFCRILGRIHPVDPAADDIRFQLNLPVDWNGKALQFGGGTFDGYLAIANGRGRTAVGLKSQASPLARGYATFGSDSGHHRSYFPLPDAMNTLSAKFARNPEMQRNFAGDALKKVHDVVVAAITQRYNRAPSRMYFIGASTGGREALRVAQRFPSDYDGVLAAYAAWDQVELDLQFIRTAKALYASGGFLGHAQTHLIARAVQQSCDAQDGLRDGIISNPSACHVDAARLRCHDGARHHGCLSDAQFHTLMTFASPQRTAMPLSNGVESIPGYNVLAGADLTYAVGVLHFPLPDPLLILNSFGYVIGDDVTRNFFSVGHRFDSLTLDTTTGGSFRAQLIRQAGEIDSTDANLRPFLAHGGKLILVHGTIDTVVPTESSVDYYRRLQSTLGAGTTADFARLYLVPGLGHGFGKFNAGFDTIGVLDAWADRGIAPAGLVVTDKHGGRTRPLCAWPAWPRYNGSGDVNAASSFSCASNPPGMRQANASPMQANTHALRANTAQPEGSPPR